MTEGQGTPILPLTLLNSIGEAAIATDPSGRVIFWNRYAESLYGWQAEEALGCNVLDLTVVEGSLGEARDIMQTLRSGGTWTGEFLVRRKDGQTFPAEVRNTPVLDDQGEIEAIIGLSTDISERKKVQRERELLIAELERANRAKDEFLTLVSHELRNPITTILGFAELLSRKGAALDKSEILAAVTDIRNDARRLKALVADLLMLARLGKDEQIPVQPVSIAEVIERVTAEYRRRNPQRLIETRASPDLPPASTHPVYLEQVLQNLLANADKYSPREEPVEIAADLSGDRLLVSVLDRGPGIPAEELPSIFEPFERGRSASQTKGLGLGLAVCRRLVEAQRGRIWVSERASGGSAFHFTVPVAG